MERTTAFPQWLDSLLIPDEIFAEAYSAVSAQQRALFKTAIARAHAILGPQRDHETLVSRSLRQGVDVATSVCAASCAVVLFDSSASPAFVLAALVPAYLAGVPEVLAVHVGEDEPSQDMLTALELAGQEQVASMDPDRCFELLAEIDASVGLRVCVVGTDSASSVPIPEVPGLALWRADVPQSLGVWLDGDDERTVVGLDAGGSEVQFEDDPEEGEFVELFDADADAAFDADFEDDSESDGGFCEDFGEDFDEDGPDGLEFVESIFDMSELDDYGFDPDQVNSNVVMFCHPAVPVLLSGPGAGQGGDDFETFLSENDVVFVPEDRLLQSLPSCRLVLGPGEESAWLWPDLPVDFFLLSRFAISRRA